MTQTTPSGPDRSYFTPRQREVLVLLGQGLMNKEIAGRLAIKESTVEYHVGRILKRLGVDSRVKAALWAQEYGLDRLAD